MLLPPCIWLCILYPVIERRIGIIEFDILVGPRQTNIGAELARSITFFSLQLVFHTIFTDYFYTTKEGSPVIETTWHYVTAWESEDVKNLDQLEVGSTVHIVGRLRVRQRRKATGEYVTVHDIIASMVETL